MPSAEFYTGSGRPIERPDLATLGAPFTRWAKLGVVQDADGSRAAQDAPAVWVLAHRGHSGMRRLDLWAYPREADAVVAGARLAMECGLGEDPQHGRAAEQSMEQGKHRKVMELYEESMPEWAVLRVEPAWLQIGTGVLRVRELKPAP